LWRGAQKEEKEENPMDGNGWSTQNEIDYIDKLVSGKALESVRAPTEVLLRNYIRSAKRRRAWGTFGSIKAQKVIRYARQRLAAVKG
jgi:hypothetical protein